MRMRTIKIRRQRGICINSLKRSYHRHPRRSKFLMACRTRQGTLPRPRPAYTLRVFDTRANYSVYYTAKKRAEGRVMRVSRLRITNRLIYSSGDDERLAGLLNYEWLQRYDHDIKTDTTIIREEFGCENFCADTARGYIVGLLLSLEYRVHTAAPLCVRL